MRDSNRHPRRRLRDPRPVLFLLTAELARGWIEPALATDALVAVPGLRLLLMGLLTWSGVGAHGACLLRAALLSGLLLLAFPATPGEQANTEVFSSPLGAHSPNRERI